MTTLTNFKNIRLNNNWNFADIGSYRNSHSEDAFYMSAYEYGGNGNTSRMIQVRKKDRTIATFVQMYHDIELPDWWKDSELLYEWREDTASNQK